MSSWTFENCRYEGWKRLAINNHVRVCPSSLHGNRQHLYAQRARRAPLHPFNKRGDQTWESTVCGKGISHLHNQLFLKFTQEINQVLVSVFSRPWWISLARPPLGPSTKLPMETPTTSTEAQHDEYWISPSYIPPLLLMFDWSICGSLRSYIQSCSNIPKPRSHCALSGSRQLLSHFHSHCGETASGDRSQTSFRPRATLFSSTLHTQDLAYP